MAVAFSLMKAWMRASSSSMLRFTAMEKSGITSSSFGTWRTVKSPGFVEPRPSVPMSSSP